MSRARRAAACLAALAGFVVPGHAAAAGGLPGTVTIASPAAGPSGYVRIELPRPQTFELCCGPGRTLAFRAGGGGLAGFLLQQERTVNAVDAPGIIGIRTAIDANDIEPPLPPDQLHLGTVGDAEELSDLESPDRKVRIPAGTYRLYLFAETPVRITIAVPGAAGEASLSPTSAVGSEVVVLEPRLTSTATGALGASRHLATGGFVYSEAWHRIATGATHLESCRYPPGSDSSSPAAYGPGCPGGGERSDLSSVYAGEGGYAGRCCSGYTWFFDASPGDWGVGGNVTQLGAPASANGPDLRGIAVWVEREGAAVPPPAAQQDQPARPDPGTRQPRARPLPSLARRSAVRIKRGLRIAFHCRATRACAGYARIPGERARLVRIGPGARRSVTLPARRVGRSAVVVVRSPSGGRSARMRVNVRR